MDRNICQTACLECLCSGCTLDCSGCARPRCIKKSIKELRACGYAAHLYDVLAERNSDTVKVGTSAAQRPSRVA